MTRSRPRTGRGLVWSFRTHDLHVDITRPGPNFRQNPTEVRLNPNLA